MAEQHAPGTLAEQIAEIRREMKQRERVYPRLVAAEKMTQDAANRQTRIMQSVLATLEACQAGNPPQPDPPASQGSLI